MGQINDPKQIRYTYIKYWFSTTSQSTPSVSVECFMKLIFACTSRQHYFAKLEFYCHRKMIDAIGQHNIFIHIICGWFTKY